MRARALPLFLLILIPALAPVLAADELEPEPGTLEVVAELPINPGNLAVTADGRVFATVHQFRRADVQLIEITGPDTYAPWPNTAWNAEFGSGLDVLNSVLGIAIDRKDRLWVIDNGLGKPNQRPKLIAFSLGSGTPVFRYVFPADTGPMGSFLNDLAVDDQRGYVYIADVGGTAEPALVTVDLNAGTSRRFTASATLQAEDLDIVVEGRVVKLPGKDGPRPARVAVNPISLSADGETLYFGAMNGETWYQVPTKLLREGAKDNEIAEAIEKAGPKPISDGASTDLEGNHYFTDLGNNAITVLHSDGRLQQLVQDERLHWPDALSFGEPRWLYIAVNQLHRASALNGGTEGAELPYLIMRVRTAADGIAGR